MRNYGIGTGKDGAVIAPPNGVYARNPTSLKEFPTLDDIRDGVRVNDALLSKVWNAFWNNYSSILSDTANALSDVYQELIAAVTANGEQPNKNNNAQLLEAIEHNNDDEFEGVTAEDIMEKLSFILSGTDLSLAWEGVIFNTVSLLEVDNVAV
jgi:hypothetical protein